MAEIVQTPQPKKPNLLVRLIAFLITVILVLGAVALVAYRDELNLDAVKRYLTYRNLETSDNGQTKSFSYIGDSTNSFATLDGGLLVCSTTGIQLFSQNGTEYGSLTVEMAQPAVSVGGGKAVVYDVGGQHLYGYSGKEMVFQYTPEGGHVILSARMNDQGWMALVAQESGHKAAVTLYNDAFEPVVGENISSSYVMDAIGSPDGRLLAVVTLGQNGTAFESTVTLYQVSDGEKRAVCSLGNDVVLELRWTADGLTVLGEEGVYLLSDQGELVGTWSNADLYLKHFSVRGEDFSVLLLGKYASGSLGRLVVLDRACEEIAAMDVSGEVLSLDAAGRYLAVLTADRLTIYNSDLEEYAVLEGTGGARRVIVREDGSAMLIGASSASLYVPN